MFSLLNALLNDPRVPLLLFTCTRLRELKFFFSLPSTLISVITADISCLPSQVPTSIADISPHDMPNYTKSGIREFIDDLDGVVRREVKRGKAKDVFSFERSRIVSFFFHHHFFRC